MRPLFASALATSWLVCPGAVCPGAAPGSAAPGSAPPTCTVQFFDWYVVTEQSPLAEKQKQWTYQIRWEDLGIEPAEIGNSEHYYRVQFEKIREAGYDGIHYEWHRNNPKPQFLAALEKTNVPLAMFYDMEIRFHGRPSFITPSREFADEVVGDVSSFYGAVPERLWLHDRNGRLPIIVYGYTFDRTVTDPAAWHEFYQGVLRGIEERLGQPAVLHWTDANAPQQVYAFQHFPEIQSFTFNEAARQTQANAHSVTFVVHYDDLGVSFARNGSRPRRWIRNDVRYLQEALWLAKHTNPDLVFNYGWNELYEGEHLLPDDRWGTWRYELAAAMIRDIKCLSEKGSDPLNPGGLTPFRIGSKAHARADLPRALVIADDLLPALDRADAAARAVLNREMNLLGRLRFLVPQADVVLSGSRPELSAYDVIFCLNRTKDAEEEAALARCGRTVVYACPDPGVDTPLTRRFTPKPRRPVPRPDLGPANEYVIASRRVDVDLRRFPRLAFRCRNSPGTVFHIRYEGVDAEGKTVAAWYESSPTDDRQTGGQWEQNEVDVAAIARQAAGRPVARLTRIDLILDDLEENGEFSLDVDYLRMTNAAGETGWEDPFDAVADWTLHAAFEAVPGARSRFGFQAVKVEGATVGQMTLQAVVREQSDDPVDESTQWIEPLGEVRVLWQVERQGRQVPLLLARGRHYWLNTYSPGDEGWEKLIPDVLGLPVRRGVLGGSFSHAVTAGGLTTRRDESVMVVGEEELPIDPCAWWRPRSWTSRYRTPSRQARGRCACKWSGEIAGKSRCPIRTAIPRA